VLLEQSPGLVGDLVVDRHDLDRGSGSHLTTPRDRLSTSDAHKKCGVGLAEHVRRGEQRRSSRDQLLERASRRLVLSLAAVTQRDKRARVDEDSAHEPYRSSSSVATLVAPDPDAAGRPSR
jgi:hypothetical protein